MMPSKTKAPMIDEQSANALDQANQVAENMLNGTAPAETAEKGKVSKEMPKLYLFAGEVKEFKDKAALNEYVSKTPAPTGQSYTAIRGKVLTQKTRF